MAEVIFNEYLLKNSFIPFILTIVSTILIIILTSILVRKEIGKRHNK